MSIDSNKSPRVVELRDLVNQIVLDALNIDPVEAHLAILRRNPGVIDARRGDAPGTIVVTMAPVIHHITLNFTL